MELHGHDSAAIIQFPPTSGYPRISVGSLHILEELLAEVRASGLFRCVVIAASSRSFASGAEVREITALDPVSALEFARRGQNTFNTIAGFPLPVVAAIRGYCLGGGLDLALACHARVATYDSTFGYPGAALGLITGWGGTERLSRLVGKAAALQLCLTGDRIPATQALTMGLVDELAPSQDLIASAVKRAENQWRVRSRRQAAGSDV